jgi:hypothetical protein
MPIKLNLAGNRQCPAETVQTNKNTYKFELSIKIIMFLSACDERRAEVELTADKEVIQKKKHKLNVMLKKLVRVVVVEK